MFSQKCHQFCKKQTLLTKRDTVACQNNKVCNKKHLKNRDIAEDRLSYSLRDVSETKFYLKFSQFT